MEIKKDEQNFTILDWYKKVVIDNYATFEGRARRSEYWYFILMNVIVTFICYVIIILGAILESPAIALTGSALILIYSLGIFIPWLAVAARRLQDTNKSGWLLFLLLIPFGNLILFIFCCLEGNNGSNQYGPNPKLAYSEDINSIGTE